VKTPRVGFIVIGLAVVAAGWPAHSQIRDNHPPEPSHTPKLVITCVITGNVKRLVEFYEPIHVDWRGLCRVFHGGRCAGDFFRGRPGKVHSWLGESCEERKRSSAIQGCRRRSRVPQASEPGYDLGQATYDTAMGNPLDLLS